MFAFHSHTHKPNVRLSKDNRISTFHSCFALVLRLLVALYVYIPNAVGCSAQSTTYNYIGHMYFACFSLYADTHIRRRVSKLWLQSIYVREPSLPHRAFQTTIRVYHGNSHCVRNSFIFAFFLFTHFTKFKIYVTFEPHEIYTLIDNETATVATAKISSYLNSSLLLFLFPQCTI